MISPTLKRIVEEELQGADIATKLQRVSSGRIDEALQQRPLRLPIKEMWRKTFPRAKEEIERYNADQRRLAIRGNSYHYEHSGSNILELAIVPYKGSIPDGYIEVPEETFAPHSNDQQQIILGEEGIIFREALDMRPRYGIRAHNQTVLVSMMNDSRHLISRPYEGILKSTISSFLKEPNDFLHDWWSSKYKDDDHFFPIVALVPETHLSLESWWQENKRDFEHSHLSEMSDWSDVPLIYASILRPELERQGYTCEARK